MGGSGETVDARKYEKVTTPTHDQGEEGKETNSVKRRGNKGHKRI